MKEYKIMLDKGKLNKQNVKDKNLKISIFWLNTIKSTNLNVSQ